ncbi:TIM barrel protein [Bifidobacterium sp. SMB2]|uniref:TIM barrel protein n=1 Tax=Bifidobacterium saimiriisciurei TaxID=2661627 RepID=A0ABX0C9V7_9BIFI|nr:MULTISPECIES: TIM barrel protein [Bifidobacterium]NEG96498.1 TIM barrel protein [Bifidobacterium sp. SMB2]NEH10585.1 TIM barrel protein [Bifidobacterium saimiriisciurei]NEH10632.1 TIM barrel protein [Bifidobacterium saimiriisciurei]
MAWELAASTLGAPYDTMDELAKTFTETGVTKIEVAVGDEMKFTMTSTDDELKAMRDELAEKANVSIFSVDSRVQVCNPDRTEDELLESLEHCLHMADVLGAQYVRVFPTAPLDPCWTPDRLPGLALPDGQNLAGISKRGAAIIVKALPLADKLGVQPLLETHDSHTNGERNAMIHAEIDRLAPGNRVGSIWDLAHPWRVGEDPVTTFEYIGQYIANGRGLVQIKDCAFPGDQTPVLQGTGRVPLAKCCRLLKNGGYTGPLSLEWERRWYPEVAPLKDALVAARNAIDNLPLDAQLA